MTSWTKEERAFADSEYLAMAADSGRSSAALVESRGRAWQSERDAEARAKAKRLWGEAGDWKA
jgi:hypothetical protein